MCEIEGWYVRPIVRHNVRVVLMSAADWQAVDAEAAVPLIREEHGL